MSPLAPEELESLRREGLSGDVRREFAASARACATWERAHPLDLAGLLDWVDQLRALLGDPRPDRSPWRGDDFRL